jgi:hypothetical protein
MTELNSAEQELAADQNDSNSAKWAGQDRDLFAGLLIVGGLLSAFLLVIGRVRKIALWAIAVGMLGAGIAVFITRLQERERKLKETEQEILTLFSQLDPLARVQVAKNVAEAELSQFERLAS